MARKVQIILTDDLTDEASDDVQTVTFGLDGTSYEIDLNGKNHDEFMGAITRYVEAARKVSVNGRTASGRRTGNRTLRSVPDVKANDGIDSKAVRAWAVEKGLMPEGRKGRIPAEIVSQYTEAVASA